MAGCASVQRGFPACYRRNSRGEFVADFSAEQNPNNTNNARNFNPNNGNANNDNVNNQNNRLWVVVRQGMVRACADIISNCNLHILAAKNSSVVGRLLTKYASALFIFLAQNLKISF